MSCSSTMTDLADGFRKRFNVSSKLSIDDMIKLITPLPGTILIPKGQLYFTGSDSNSIAQDAWAVIPESEVINPSDNLMKARDGGTVRLHLFITSKDTGTAVIKWDQGNDTTTAFSIKPGMIAVDLPQPGGTPSFRLAIHALTCGFSFDQTQSYLELIPKKQN